MQEANSLLTILAKSGFVGITLAAIILCGFSMWLLYKTVTNHINHSNNIFEKNAEVMTELVKTIENLRDMIRNKL